MVGYLQTMLNDNQSRNHFWQPVIYGFFIFIIYFVDIKITAVDKAFLLWK